MKRTGASRETVRRGAWSDAGRRFAAPTERPPPNPARFVNCR
ncbi:glycosyl transferase [Burkholderia pseudomallei]|nr:glycosyl transferase [Burkholderia pseudomallei]AYX38867.1 glycosyl transferase [Burkholderia pseudomallei]KIX54097.1 glycosyl transferase [Burkholderia pseudomallei]MBK3335204.1 glycosyl transferase [Burkholderia pseudomallei]OAB03721.1 glycosyl transferase [Burkholderia pseudomallei]